MYAELKKLEFDKILKILKNYIHTDLGKERVLEITPLVDSIEITRLLQETDEAKNLIERYDQTPLTGVLDVREIVKKAEIYSVLTVDELLKIVSHQEAIARTIVYVKKVISLNLDFTHLSDYYNRIVSLPDLKNAIDKVIDKKGEIYDTASHKLAEIRRKIKTTEDRIESKMQSMLKSEQSKLIDSLITIRNNRLVLPVKQEFKNSVKGLIHDQSASGETVFIEPISCVEMNNDLSRYYVQESQEIENILRELTLKVSEYSEELKNNLEIFTYLDIVFGKAKYALQNDFTRPIITKNKISLLNAKHPLISKDVVVGNNIIFHDYHHIIITGPNTGGKTVALKTLGLLSIMVQSGMLIPVNENSETMIFSNIFADIGDEQSIEQSLSTFSSHISNIIKIIDKAADNSLVLLDEIGSGTDPKEGASLAMAIIDNLRNRKIYSMITTHYPELKTYAYDLENTVNASVEFDIETLKPTYRLKIGIPGTSNAIQIARRLGLNEKICKDAENVSLSFDTDTSKLIQKIEKQSIELDNELSNYREKIKLLEQEKDNYKKLLKEELVRQNKVLEEYETIQKQKQESYLKRAQELIEELNELKNSSSFKEHELARLKKDVKDTFYQKVKYHKTSDKGIKVGDTVKVLSYQRNALVNKELKNEQYEVVMGALTLNVKKSEIEFVKSGVNEEIETRVKSPVSPIRDVKVELDLHGKRYEEAMLELDKFVDDCLLNNLEFAYIVHGIGTGALKKGVEAYAKSNPHVKTYRRGNEGEGGMGVTVYQFK
ncbi:MAG: endonuclease MutS2 [Candidatus Izemoplasmatales bacterium]|nr:endonuclease MutS2 [Candidatus Izemoplasmatales bacterium]